MSITGVDHWSKVTTRVDQVKLIVSLLGAYAFCFFAFIDHHKI